MFIILNKNKGFTLIESLVVIAIIAILFVIVFPYHSARKQFALQRSANKLAQDIRRAQGLALGAEELATEGSEGVKSVPEGGYGIYLRKVPAPEKFYVLFADTDDNHQCDGCNSEKDEFIEKILFEGGIKIKDLDNPNVNIIFIPPDPAIFLTDGDGDDLFLNQVSIVISLIDDESKTKTITVNKAGLIYVE